MKFRNHAWLCLGFVHKRRQQLEGVVQCGHFADKGGRVLQMRTSALFGAKTSDFLKFMVRPHGPEGLNQCGHFSDKGEEGQFCADVFYGRP